MAFVEQAGLENCSGCGCLLIMSAIGLGALITHGLGSRAAGPHYARLISLMTDFVGGDQSRRNVEEIHSLLLNRFASDGAYAEVIAATASFMPGGTAPFYDEARLEEAFRTFLREQNVFVPDAPQDQTGVWPPPPNAGRE